MPAVLVGGPRQRSKAELCVSRIRAYLPHEREFEAETIGEDNEDDRVHHSPAFNIPIIISK